ncbi:MAG TPA: sulfurtransferase [Thermoanaerobaculia bacterium]|nr:sulfurtransferase [Thermoanaerobaculia bacterium]
MSALISPADLLRLLETSEDVVLLDARPGGTSYAADHLRGARHADLDTQLSAAREDGADPARGGRHPLPSLDRWVRLLGSWGITPSKQVVVYDDQAGANAAARTWWMLRAIGHERVSVLDGGFAAAVAAGVPVTTAEEVHAPQPPYPATAWQRPVVDMERVDALREDKAWRVLDVRSRERFRGETEPIDPVAGHIPGAINLPFADNLEEGRFKSAETLRAQYEQLLGGTPVSRLVVHCGSGVTACHTLLALEHAGLAGASLYIGSWSEWCRGGKPQAKGE